MTEAPDIYQRVESNVRSYCRSWPTSFTKAHLHEVYDESGKPYIDFFAGAGALNYGHNNPVIKQAVIDYLNEDGIVHSLDMHTAAKGSFLESFESRLLTRLTDRYKVMFTGPTGADAVEAAVRLARKVTGRQTIGAFNGSYHGMTAGALSLSSLPQSQATVETSVSNDTIFLPFDEGTENDQVTPCPIELRLNGLAEEPAAIILETTQAEGGANIARTGWLKKLEKICRNRGILLILDDIQMGCGRTGPFFSSERADLRPDLIVLSKSLGAFGVPLSVVLIKTDLDAWRPGEHSGTFRGQNLAFVAGKTALETYWSTPGLETQTRAKGAYVFEQLNRLKEAWPSLIHSIRGQGFFFGIEFNSAEQAAATASAAFNHGLLIERAGKDRRVIKISPPLVISQDALAQGLEILAAATEACATKAPLVEVREQVPEVEANV